MKSKKAEDYIDAHVVNFYGYKPMSRTAGYVVRLTSAIHAVELAKQEAEERVRAELTRWHDPKEELPDTNRDVLIKTTMAAKYRIAFYKADGWRNYHWQENNGAIDDDMVIGWREIHK